MRGSPDVRRNFFSRMAMRRPPFGFDVLGFSAWLFSVSGTWPCHRYPGSFFSLLSASGSLCILFFIHIRFRAFSTSGLTTCGVPPHERGALFFVLLCKLTAVQPLFLLVSRLFFFFFFAQFFEGRLPLWLIGMPFTTVSLNPCCHLLWPRFSALP